MKVDLAEGRRLLDAYREHQYKWPQKAHIAPCACTDVGNWIYANGETMLTLLERTRTALHDLKQDHHEIRDCTCGTCEVAYQVWNVLTATDAGDPLSLLEPENLP